MAINVTEDSDGTDGARGEPVASNCRVGKGDGYAGGGGVGVVVCYAAVAIGHGLGGGWEVARGKMRPFFAKMILLRTTRRPRTKWAKHILYFFWYGNCI